MLLQGGNFGASCGRRAVGGVGTGTNDKNMKLSKMPICHEMFCSRAVYILSIYRPTVYQVFPIKQKRIRLSQLFTTRVGGPSSTLGRDLVPREGTAAPSKSHDSDPGLPLRIRPYSAALHPPPSLALPHSDFAYLDTVGVPTMTNLSIDSVPQSIFHARNHSRNASRASRPSPSANSSARMVRVRNRRVPPLEIDYPRSEGSPPKRLPIQKSRRPVEADNRIEAGSFTGSCPFSSSGMGL